MPLVMLGLSHNTGAPVDVRERISFTTPGALDRALGFLRNALGRDSECVLLSTCNRTELYLSTPQDLPTEDVHALLQVARGPEAEALPPYLEERRGCRVIEHLFRVTAGLESMVLGETDIVRQVKESYARASERGLCSATLDPLFHKAMFVAKRTRTECDLGRGAFSIGHAAAEVARNIFGDGRGRTVLLLGAGKMSETTARHLAAGGTTTILVANRTYDRAVRLAEALNGHAIHYDSFADHLAKTDIVIASTAAPHAVVTRSLVAEALRHRRHRDPLFFIDIAVPRDVEESVGDLPNVFVYNIDNLRQLVEEDMVERRHKASHAEAIVHEEAMAFAEEQRMRLTAAPLISSMRAKQEILIQAEMQRLQQRLGHLSESDLSVIRAAMASFGNKTLHDPTLKIREYAAADEQTATAKIETVREIFGLATHSAEDDR